MNIFRPATKQQSKLRMTIDGPAGAGKTFTALRFAHVLAEGGRIAFIDTERGSASKYVDEAPDGTPWAFDVLELTEFSPERYTEAIVAAGKAGYKVLVIDSLSHAWEGEGGILETKQKYGESWSAWRHVTPIHNRMVDTILQAPLHVITTMRSRIEYVQEPGPNGKVIIRKVGMSPIQRPGMEYEFDIVADMDYAHVLTVSKSRCTAVDGMTIEKPGPGFMAPVMEWLGSGKNERVYAPAPEVTQAPNFSQAEKLEPQLHSAQTQAVMSLQDLMDSHSIEAILTANGGRIPATSEEINAVVERLR